jgi:uncharacterized protein (TIGR02145 family)
MKTTIFLLTCLAFLTNRNQAQTVTDIDGNLYNTVTINTQVWLKENLKVTHYNNSDEIPNVASNTTWLGLSTGAYCNYENNTSYASIYGRLYNWFAVNDSRGICPTGWHVATDAEWTVLTDLLGGETVAGGKLKEVGTLHWPSPNTGATNEVGFTALGGGYRSNTATYIGFGGIGSWWCSTESSTTNAWARGIFNDAVNVDRGGYYEKMMGFSVRCVMDPVNGSGDQNFEDKIMIYPNPVEDRIYINYCRNPKIEVKIFNLPGKCILQKTLNECVSDIDIHSLRKGLYIIEINGDHETVRLKMIKN